MYCNLGGGWTVIERRYNGELTFDKNWDTFKAGFGALDEEFYVGNEKFHQLTNVGIQEIYFSIVLRNGEYSRISESRINFIYQSFKKDFISEDSHQLQLPGGDSL